MILSLIIGTDLSQKKAKEFYDNNEGRYEVELIDNIEMIINEPLDELGEILDELTADEE